MENPTDAIIQTALRMYENQKKASRNYRQTHKEKVNQNSKNYYYRLREDPEKYKAYLEKCNKKYAKIREDPEKYEAYLEKEKARYIAKKSKKENLDTNCEN